MADAGRTAASPLVLIGDDDPEIRELVADVLTEAGFRAIAVADGAVLLERALALRPALIVLDVMMTTMDGYTTVVQLRGHRETQSIPVIVVTAQDAALYRSLSAGVGAAAHISKPFSTRELADTAHRVLADHETRGSREPLT